MIKVTLITASYNNERTIGDTVQSVLNQIHKSIEFIIIDGASRDNTLNVVRKLTEHVQAPAIKIVSEADSGIYDALNKGLALATGDVIGFLHADDLLFNREVLQQVAEVFTQNNVEAVYGDLQYVAREDISRVIRNWISRDFKPSLLKKGWMPPHPTLYLKKEVYEKFGNFDTTFRIAADYDFMLRIFKGGIRSVYLPRYMVQMRVGGKSNAFRNLTKKMKEDVKALKKNHVGGIYSLLLKNLSKVSQFF